MVLSTVTSQKHVEGEERRAVTSDALLLVEGVDPNGCHHRALHLETAPTDIPPSL